MEMEERDNFPDFCELEAPPGFEPGMEVLQLQRRPTLLLVNGGIPENSRVPTLFVGFVVFPLSQILLPVFT